MSIVLMSEKGQVTIPQDIRKRLRIAKGDPLVVDVDSQGGIRLRVAAVLPMETYSDARLKAFREEDRMTPAERRQVQKLLNG